MYKYAKDTVKPAPKVQPTNFTYGTYTPGDTDSTYTYQQPGKEPMNINYTDAPIQRNMQGQDIRGSFNNVYNTAVGDSNGWQKKMDYWGNIPQEDWNRVYTPATPEQRKGYTGVTVQPEGSRTMQNAGDYVWDITDQVPAAYGPVYLSNGSAQYVSLPQKTSDTPDEHAQARLNGTAQWNGTRIQAPYSISYMLQQPNTGMHEVIHANTINGYGDTKHIPTAPHSVYPSQLSYNNSWSQHYGIKPNEQLQAVTSLNMSYQAILNDMQNNPDKYSEEDRKLFQTYKAYGDKQNFIARNNMLRQNPGLAQKYLGAEAMRPLVNYEDIQSVLNASTKWTPEQRQEARDARNKETARLAAIKEAINKDPNATAEDKEAAAKAYDDHLNTSTVDAMTEEEYQQYIKQLQEAQARFNDMYFANNTQPWLPTAADGCVVTAAMHKQAYATPAYRQLARIARPYYQSDGTGANWAHIQEVRRRAAKMMRKLEGRSLTPAEYAAILFHDSTKNDMGKENHGRLGALRASQLLAHALTPQQLAEASEAIAVHDDNLPKFPSHTAELLASADANPPDLEWGLNKAYCYQLGKGLKGMDRYSVSVNNMARKYGVNGTFNVPGIYSQYHGNKVRMYQEALDSMTPEAMEKLVTAYRQKYNIGMDEAKVIHNR